MGGGEVTGDCGPSIRVVVDPPGTPTCLCCMSWCNVGLGSGLRDVGQVRAAPFSWTNLSKSSVRVRVLPRGLAPTGSGGRPSELERCRPRSSDDGKLTGGLLPAPW